MAPAGVPRLEPVMLLVAEVDLDIGGRREALRSGPLFASIPGRRRRPEALPTFPTAF